MPQQSTSAQLLSRGTYRIKTGGGLLWAGIVDWAGAGGMVVTEFFVVAVTWLFAPFAYLVRVVSFGLSGVFRWIRRCAQVFFTLASGLPIWDALSQLLQRVLYWAVIGALALMSVLLATFIGLAAYYSSSFVEFPRVMLFLTLASVLLFIAAGLLLLSKLGVRFERTDELISNGVERLLKGGDQIFRFIGELVILALKWILGRIKTLFGLAVRAVKLMLAGVVSIRGSVGVWAKSVRKRFARSDPAQVERASPVPIHKDLREVKEEEKAQLYGSHSEEVNEFSTSNVEGARLRKEVRRTTFSLFSRGGRAKSEPKTLSLLNLFSADWVSLFGITLLVSWAFIALAAEKSVIQWGPRAPEQASVSRSNDPAPNILRPIARILTRSAYSISKPIFSGPHQILSMAAYINSKWRFDDVRSPDPALQPLLNGDYYWREESSLVFEGYGQPVHYLKQVSTDPAVLCGSRLIFVVGLASRGGPAKLNESLSQSRAYQFAEIISRLALQCKGATTPTIVAVSYSEAFEGSSEPAERSLLAFGMQWLPSVGWDVDAALREQIQAQKGWAPSLGEGRPNICIYSVGDGSSSDGLSVPECSLRPNADWPMVH